MDITKKEFPMIISDIDRGKLKYCDPLTDLFNKDFFLDNLEYEISKKDKEGCVVIILALNEFQQLNNDLGYLMGYQMLREFALILRRSVGVLDFISRFEYNKFAVLIPDMKDKEEMMRNVNKIKENLNAYSYINNKKFQITLSMGTSRYPYDSTEVVGLIEKAEISRKQFKESSKFIMNQSNKEALERIKYNKLKNWGY